MAIKNWNYLHTKLCQKYSSLKGDILRCNIIESPHCYCGHQTESIDLFFLSCDLYDLPRLHLFHCINSLG